MSSNDKTIHLRHITDNGFSQYSGINFNNYLTSEIKKYDSSIILNLWLFKIRVNCPKPVLSLILQM